MQDDVACLLYRSYTAPHHELESDDYYYYYYYCTSQVWLVQMQDRKAGLHTADGHGDEGQCSLPAGQRPHHGAVAGPQHPSRLLATGQQPIPAVSPMAPCQHCLNQHVHVGAWVGCSCSSSHSFGVNMVVLPSWISVSRYRMMILMCFSSCGSDCIWDQQQCEQQHS